MADSACRREDIVAAFEDLHQRLEERRSSLWKAYAHATASMPRQEYEIYEHECWTVLEAGLSGIDAEQRLLQRGYEQRLALADDTGAVA